MWDSSFTKPSFHCLDEISVTMLGALGQNLRGCFMPAMGGSTLRPGPSSLARLLSDPWEKQILFGVIQSEPRN